MKNSVTTKDNILNLQNNNKTNFKKFNIANKLPHNSNPKNLQNKCNFKLLLFLFF